MFHVFCVLALHVGQYLVEHRIGYDMMVGVCFITLICKWIISNDEHKGVPLLHKKECPKKYSAKQVMLKKHIKQKKFNLQETTSPLPLQKYNCLSWKVIGIIVKCLIDHPELTQLVSHLM